MPGRKCTAAGAFHCAITRASTFGAAGTNCRPERLPHNASCCHRPLGARSATSTSSTISATLGAVHAVGGETAESHAEAVLVAALMTKPNPYKKSGARNGRHFRAETWLSRSAIFIPTNTCEARLGSTRAANWVARLAASRQILGRRNVQA